MSPKTPDTAASFAGVQISGPHEPMAVYVMHIDGQRRTVLIPLDALREGATELAGKTGRRYERKKPYIGKVLFGAAYLIVATLIGALSYWFGAVVMR